MLDLDPDPVVGHKNTNLSVFLIKTSLRAFIVCTKHDLYERVGPVALVIIRRAPKNLIIRAQGPKDTRESTKKMFPKKILRP